MTHAFIYLEEKNPEQSGLGRVGVKRFIVKVVADDFSLTQKRQAWQLSQVAHFSPISISAFETLDLAVNFVKEKNIPYIIIPHHTKLLRRKSYAENF